MNPARSLARILPLLPALAGAAFAAEPAPAPAAPALSTEERLARLEGELSSLRQENQALRHELGLEKRGEQPVIKPAGRETMLAIGGLIQAQADFLDKGDSRFSSENDRFYLRRARISATGKFKEDFDFRVEFDLAGSLGETTSMRAQATDAYINWTKYDFASVRVGQFKSGYGYEQLAADPKLLTIERSLVNDRLTLGRQIGVQVGGDVLDKRLSYSTGVFNGTGVNTSANDNDDFLATARVSGVPIEGKIRGQEAKWTVAVDAFASKDQGLTGQPAEFGFDSTPATVARDNTFTGQRSGLGADTQLRFGLFDLWAEYLRSNFEQSLGRDSDAEGAYVQGTYYVIPKTLQALVKFDCFDPNVDIDGNTTETWTFGVNYYLKGDDLKLQLNYLLSDIPGSFEQQDKILLRLQAVF